MKESKKISFKLFFKYLKRKQKIVVISSLLGVTLLLISIGLFPLWTWLINGNSIYARDDTIWQFGFSFMGTGFTIFMILTGIYKIMRKEI